MLNPPGSDGLIEMSEVIPFWRIPIAKYAGASYHGVCNNFFAFGDRLSPDITRRPFVPQPIPDGRGVVGLSEHRSRSGSLVEERLTGKIYISTNLARVLKKDSIYRLDFALGFGVRDTIGSQFFISGSPVKFAIFGLKDSTHIPFTKPESPGLLGCLPLHFPEWIELGSVVISGNRGTWQRGIIDFIAPADIESIALGPTCDNSDVPYTSRGANEVTDYYFIDDLKFYQASAPKPMLQQLGSKCEDQTTTLRLQPNDFYNGSAFQWYLNNKQLPETGVALTTSSAGYGPGWYKMQVQNDSVCMMTDSVFLEWAPQISNPFPGNTDTTLCMGESIELKIDAGPGTAYLWNTGSTDPAITVTKAGTYSVKISNACNALNALKTVLYKDCPPSVFVPTAFTPNGDGLNDVFRVSATGTLKSFSLAVYDRFGQRIFYSTDPAKGWDGKVKDKVQSTSLFIWMLQYTDGSDKKHAQKGTIALIR